MDEELVRFRIERPAWPVRAADVGGHPQRRERAIKEIEDDPFVRDLVENFEARVVESTIKPLQ